MTNINYALEDFKNIQDIIKFIDQKAGVLLVVYGLLFTIFLDIFKSLKLINPLKLHSLIPIMFSILCFISGTSFIVLSFFVIYILIFKIIKPKKASNYINNEVCLFYFDHIANQTKQQFITKFNTINEDTMLSEILGQVYEVSKILKCKEDDFRICAKLLFFSIISIISYAISLNLV